MLEMNKKIQEVREEAGSRIAQRAEHVIKQIANTYKDATFELFQ